MTLYRATGRGAPRRCRRVHAQPSAWRPFLRAASAVALSVGGVLALLVVLLAQQFRLGLGGVAAVEMVALGGILIGAGWVLALPSGEAWDWATSRGEAGS